MSSFVDRMVGAARLDTRIYEEVEADTTATTQAMGVVVLSAAAAGIGGIRSGPTGLVTGLVLTLLGWFAWAGITYLIGTRVLPEPQTKSDVGEMLRTTGFSAAPGILRILGVIPLLGWVVVGAASIWMLVAMVIAVRQALDYRSTGRALAVCLIGWVAFMVLSTMFWWAW
jgi:hypothetical protein